MPQPPCEARPLTVSFVIPVKNDARRLERCLDAITRNQDATAAADVIVADNGSTDHSRDVATAAGARVLSLPGLRVPELRNRGAQSVTGAVLAFVDADHEIGPTWLASAIDALDEAGVGAVGALYSAPPRGSWVQQMYGALRGRTVGRNDVSWLGSGNLAVRRDAFEAIGGFDASLEACEDVDFCKRLRAAGWRVVGDERLESVHVGDPATLGALFRAERWRGRDNIRVSLRGPLALRDVPSLVIPIVDLAAGAVCVAGVLASPLFGTRSLLPAAASLLAIGGLAALRALRMASSARLRSPLALGRAFLVAVTYDLARAAALLTRAPHHRHAPTDGSAAASAPLR
jgi:hypothetical protein